MVKNIDELFNAASIKFPEPQTADQVEELFEYIAKELPARIEYSDETHHGLNGDMNCDGSRVFQREEMSVKMRGTMTAHGSVDYAHASFFCEQDMSNPLLMTHLRFFMTPGYTPHDHSEHDRKMWGLAKMLAEQYFTDLARQQNLPLDND